MVHTRERTSGSPIPGPGGAGVCPVMCVLQCACGPSVSAINDPDLKGTVPGKSSTLPWNSCFKSGPFKTLLDGLDVHCRSDTRLP